MKRRYSVWRLRLGGYRSEAMRRLGKRPEDGKLDLGDVVMCCSLIVPFCCDSFFESLPYGKGLMLIATALVVLVGMVLKFRRLAPRPCWGRALWASLLLTLFWSLLPWVFYFGGDKDVCLELATEVSISSLFMWAVTLVCALRYRYIRRRSKQEIALMRMRERRRKQIVY